VGDGAADSSVDSDYGECEAPLHASEEGDGGEDGAECGESAGADCGDSDGRMEQDCGEGDAVWSAAVEGDQSGACALGG
jgi:hypothetical protein